MLLACTIGLLISVSLGPVMVGTTAEETLVGMIGVDEQ